jgi:hypothetical protein
MTEIVRQVRVCWRFVRPGYIRLVIILAAYAILSAGFGIGSGQITLYSFPLKYLHTENASRTLRVVLQENFSLTWLAVWAVVVYESLQCLSRFFSPSMQLWLGMRGVPRFTRLLTAISWSFWLSSLVAVGTAWPLAYGCWRFGFGPSLAVNQSVGIFGAIAMAHIGCCGAFAFARLTSPARQGVVVLSLVFPFLLLISGGVILHERFAEKISVFPAAAPYIYAIPGLDFGKLVFSTIRWDAALLVLLLASAVLRERFVFRKTSTSSNSPIERSPHYERNETVCSN